MNQPHYAEEAAHGRNKGTLREGMGVLRLF